MTIHFDWINFLKRFRIIYKGVIMKTIKYTFWEDEGVFMGFLNDYPDYETQGHSKDELLDNLKSLLEDIESEEIPFIKKVEEFAIA